jgi:epsilon-lactone hydrolase
MSIRAELIRLGLRYLLKTTADPGATIAAHRHRQQLYERWVPRPPRESRATVGRLGGVSTTFITMPVSQPDRHVLYLHGGGYVIGSPVLYRHMTWRFAAAARARIAAIDYRLAPENPFPAAIDDALAAWQGLLAAGADPRQAVVMGDSAGGGLALALALRLRDTGGLLPAAVVALSPWTDLALTGDSLQRNADSDPMVSSAEIPAIAALYLAGADPYHPYASPLYGDHAGLPPTLIQVGSDEVLRDDSVRIAERLRAAGCVVELDIWKRMPHVWHAFAAMMPEARKAIARIGLFVERMTAKPAIPAAAK